MKVLSRANAGRLGAEEGALTEDDQSGRGDGGNVPILGYELGLGRELLEAVAVVIAHLDEGPKPRVNWFAVPWFKRWHVIID